jgi:hypothetical protein
MKLKYISALAVFVGVGVAVLLPTQNALAQCKQDGYWATSGHVHASVSPARGKEKNFTLRVEFTMTQDQVNISRCVGAYIEFDNELDGFSLPNQWDNYTAASNLPGWLHDLAVSDFGGVLQPSSNLFRRKWLKRKLSPAA